jgi:hypothetical protein
VAFPQRDLLKVSRWLSACAPRLAALGHPTDRGDHRLAAGRRLREALDQRQDEVRRRRCATCGQRWGDRCAGRSRSRARSHHPAGCESSSADAIPLPPRPWFQAQSVGEAALGRAAFPQWDLLKVSRWLSACVPRLAALGHRTDRGARRLPLGRRLREALGRRPVEFRRHRVAAGSSSRHGQARGRPRGGGRAGRSRSRAARRRLRTPDRLLDACESSAAESIAIPPRAECQVQPSEEPAEKAAPGRAEVAQGELPRASRWSLTRAPPLAAPGNRTDRDARRLSGLDRCPAELRWRRSAAGSWSCLGWTAQPPGERGRKATLARAPDPQRELMKTCVP